MPSTEDSDGKALATTRGSEKNEETIAKGREAERRLGA